MTQSDPVGNARPAAPRRSTTNRRLVSGTGLLVGFAFFAASLQPSLIPRDALMQGVLGGGLFAVGYGLGVLFIAAWVWLGLPQIARRTGVLAALLAAGLGLALAVAALSQTERWQNSVREFMAMEPITSSLPLQTSAIAAATAAAFFLVAYLFKLLARLFVRRTRHFLPERVSIAISLTAAVLIFVALVDGVLVRYGMRVLDASYAEIDAFIDPDAPPPVDPLKPGSAASLVDWRALGRDGRRFVSNTPTAEEIGEFWGEPAMAPLRVYVGLNAGDTPQQRAELALRELIRVGGFERAILAVATPTGTGFMEEFSTRPLEYLHRGDVTTVAQQYSYMQSPFSLIFEPGYGAESARALFRAVYDYWTAMPKDNRPKLFLQGLSLGSLSSEAALRLHEVLGDPPNGALWSGPPFPSQMHREVTAERDPGSPQWLPIFEDGAFIRFTNQDNALGIYERPWGRMRIVYLQYASDPIVFFDTATLWRRPDWLTAPRGPDVSPLVRWYPIVTAFQLLADMPLATTAPRGYGHEYAAGDYIDSWVSITDPDVTQAQIDRLKTFFADWRGP